jgi:hypothetical protein
MVEKATTPLKYESGGRFGNAWDEPVSLIEETADSQQAVGVLVVVQTGSKNGFVQSASGQSDLDEEGLPVAWL